MDELVIDPRDDHGFSNSKERTGDSEGHTYRLCGDRRGTNRGERVRFKGSSLPLGTNTPHVTSETILLDEEE